MPGIRRARQGYSAIGTLDINDFEGGSQKPMLTQYCHRCKDLFGVYSPLGPRVLPIDKKTGKPISKPADYDSWLECHGCGTVYAKHEIKQEAQLTSLVEPESNPFDRSKGVIEGVRESKRFDKSGKTQMKRKRKQQIDDVKDPDVKQELQKPGTELISYEEINVS